MPSSFFTVSYLLLIARLADADPVNYGNHMSSSQVSNQQPVVAHVQQQACGVPNGDSSYLTNLQHQVGSRRRRSDEDDGAFLEERIIGGSDVPGGVSSMCWEVSVFVSTGNSSVACAGTIVGSRTVLTSAYCVVGPAVDAGVLPDYTIAIGWEANLTANPVTVSTGVITTIPVGQKSGRISQQIAGCAKNYTVVKSVYQNYDLATANNGVLILTLTEPIDFRANGGCACKLCLSQKTPSVGDTCVVSGWGRAMDAPADASQPAIPLRYVKQAIQQPSSDPNVCYQTDPNVTAVVPLDRFYCAGGVANEGWCGGDQGAPLTCYDPKAKVQYLAGMSEYRAECGSTVASRFTKVSLYLRWIFDNAPLGDVSILN